MDIKLEEIENKLTKLKERCPNIANIWKIYIDVRKNSLKRSLLECEKTINKIETENGEDLSKNVICLMYLLNNTI